MSITSEKKTTLKAQDASYTTEWVTSIVFKQPPSPPTNLPSQHFKTSMNFQLG